MVIKAFAVLILLITASSTYADELDDVRQELKAVEVHSKLWQYGWTSVFSGSLLIQGKTLADEHAKESEKFDAKVSLVTSGSGLLSTLMHPLPAAFSQSFHDSPEQTTEERAAKIALGRRILAETRVEVERRRSWPFQVFVISEQVLAAGAIAWLDKRPDDAGRRFLLGVVSSELFIYSTPWMENGSAVKISAQLLPHAVTIQFEKFL